MERLTPEELDAAYQAAAELYLFSKYEVDVLDRKFSEYTPVFIPAPWRTELKEYLPLEYISLLNRAHTERLSEREKTEFEGMISKDTDYDTLSEFLEKTYRCVLAGSTGPGVMVEYFRDIHERGTFPGDAIVFAFSDIPEYDEKGYRDPEREEQKNLVFNYVKDTYEKLVNNGSDDRVILVRY